MDPVTISSIFTIGSKIIDKLFPDPVQRDAAKLELLKQEQLGNFDEMQLQLSAILAEANSSDPWTSRARPSFLYLFYLVIIFLVMIAPIIGVFFNNEMQIFYTNVDLGFKAIPEPLWWTFTTGYLGYTAARQYGKNKGTDR